MFFFFLIAFDNVVVVGWLPSRAPKNVGFFDAMRWANNCQLISLWDSCQR